LKRSIKLLDTITKIPLDKFHCISNKRYHEGTGNLINNQYVVKIIQNPFHEFLAIIYNENISNYLYLKNEVHFKKIENLEFK
jgi:hypothetical protein